MANSNDNLLKLQFDGRRSVATFKANRVLIGLRVTAHLPLASGETFPSVFRVGQKVVDFSKVDVDLSHCGQTVIKSNLKQLSMLCGYQGFDYESMRYADNPMITDTGVTAGVITYDLKFPAGLNFYCSENTPFELLGTCQREAAAGKTATTGTLTLGASTVTYVSHIQTGVPMINTTTAEIHFEPIYAPQNTPVSRVSPFFEIRYVPVGETLTSVDIPNNCVQIRLVDERFPRVGNVNPNIAHLPTVVPFTSVSIDSPRFNRNFTPSQVISQGQSLLNTFDEMKQRVGDYVLYDAAVLGGMDIDAGTLQVKYGVGTIAQGDTHWIGFVGVKSYYREQGALADQSQKLALSDIYTREKYAA